MFTNKFVNCKIILKKLKNWNLFFFLQGNKNLKSLIFLNILLFFVFRERRKKEKKKGKKYIYFDS